VKVKRLIILLVLILMSTFVNAQRRVLIENLPSYDYKPYHFGFILGLNKMDFAIRPKEDFKEFDSLFVLQSVPQWGFDIGIVGNLRLTQYLDFRFIPTLTFGDRNLNYKLAYKDTIIYNEVKKVESTLLEFPLLLKYKSARLTNVRAYVIGGAKYTIDLASKQSKKDQDEELVKLRKHDYAFEVGVGFDFYLEYFKFATELKMAYGIRDLLIRDQTIYTTPIDRLNSKTLMISFLFE